MIFCVGQHGATRVEERLRARGRRFARVRPGDAACVQRFQSDTLEPKPLRSPEWRNAIVELLHELDVIRDEPGQKDEHGSRGRRC